MEVSLAKEQFLVLRIASMKKVNYSLVIHFQYAQEGKKNFLKMSNNSLNSSTIDNLVTFALKVKMVKL